MRAFLFCTIFFIGLNLLSFSQAEANLPLNGRIYTDQYLYTDDSQARSLAQSSTSFWLDFESHTDQGLGTHWVGQVDFFYRDLNQPDKASIGYQLREGYVSYLTPGSELKIGQQIIPWGKSDGVNPTDFFTAKNLSLLNPDDEVKRIGAPALNYVFTPDEGNSPFTFQFIFQAYYPQMKLLIPDQAIPSGIVIQKYPSPPTAFQTHSMEYGFKIAYLKSNFDWSVSFFKGVAQYPEYIFNPNTVSISSINPKESAIGTDASFNLDRYTIRLESALHMPENGTREDPFYGLVEPWHWDSVVGAEQALFDDFRVQLQFLYRWHLYFQNPASNANPNPLLNRIQQAVAQANALILNYQRQGNPGATFRLSYQNDSSLWTADLFLIGYFSNGQDYLIRPQVGYSPLTNLKLQMGLDLYGGEKTRPLGALKSRSDAFFEAKYVF